MRNDHHLLALLHELGTHRVCHVGGMLSEHLVGTADLLTQWHARPALTTAGLFHAMYGTDGFNSPLIEVNSRQRLVDMIGEESESIVFHYGAMDRAVFHARLGTHAQYLVVNRFEGRAHTLSDQTLRDLCELTAANELDIALRQAAFRRQYGLALQNLFKKMGALLSPACRQAYQIVLG